METAAKETNLWITTEKQRNLLTCLTLVSLVLLASDSNMPDGILDS